MSFFEISVLIFLGVIAIELFLLIAAAGWFTDQWEKESKAVREQDDADWWKNGGGGND